MATFNKFDCLLLDLATKKHNLTTDTIKVMLTNNAPVATNTIKTNITEVSGNGLAAGGVVIDTTASQTGGVLSVAIDGDDVITATGGTIGAFRYAVVYNDTEATKPLISWYDYGSSITLADGESLTLDYAATLFTASFA